jgi:hypothetical protein
LVIIHRARGSLRQPCQRWKMPLFFAFANHAIVFVTS